MSAVYWSRNNPQNDRLLSSCKTASVFWHHSRIECDVHWRWDDEQKCYQTHRWTSDARYKDVRSWPAGGIALSSFLAAVRGDDRLAGDPMIRLMAFYMTLEYLTAALERYRP